MINMKKEDYDLDELNPTDEEDKTMISEDPVASTSVPENKSEGKKDDESWLEIWRLVDQFAGRSKSQKRSFHMVVLDENGQGIKH